MTDTQLELFRAYHSSDKSLKERIFSVENKVLMPLKDLPYILEGEDYRSTSKTSTQKLPLRPNSYSQFGLMEPDLNLQKNNVNLTRELIKNINFNQFNVNNQIRGYVSSEPISSEHVADFLDSLEFTHHRPSMSHPDYKRWKQYAETYGAKYFSKINDLSESKNLLNVGRCPYSIASYLRFWGYVTVPANSLKNDLFVFPTSIMWRDEITPPPGFFVTIRSGSVSDIELQSSEGKLEIKSAKRSRNNNDQRLVDNVWGTASGSTNQYDDKLFDYHHNNYFPVPKYPISGMTGVPLKHRPSDHPGHLAIYFIEDDNGGINVGIGFALPSGSPEHIRSMSGE